MVKHGGHNVIAWACMAAGTTKTFSDTFFFLCHMVYLATTNNKRDPQKSEYQRNPENLNNFRFYYSEERLKAYLKETGTYVLLQAGEKRYWSHYSSSGWLLREKGL